MCFWRTDFNSVDRTCFFTTELLRNRFPQFPLSKTEKNEIAKGALEMFTVRASWQEATRSSWWTTAMSSQVAVGLFCHHFWCFSVIQKLKMKSVKTHRIYGRCKRFVRFWTWPSMVFSSIVLHSLQIEPEIPQFANESEALPDQLSPSALCGHVGFVATSTIWTALGEVCGGHQNDTKSTCLERFERYAITTFMGVILFCWWLSLHYNISTFSKKGRDPMSVPKVKLQWTANFRPAVQKPCWIQRGRAFRRVWPWAVESGGFPRPAQSCCFGTHWPGFPRDSEQLIRALDWMFRSLRLDDQGEDTGTAKSNIVFIIIYRFIYRILYLIIFIVSSISSSYFKLMSFYLLARVRSKV